MTGTAATPIPRADAAPTAGAMRQPIIDADVHVYFASDDALDPYLPAMWREHRRAYGARRPTGQEYPRFHPHAARTDAYPPSGVRPGADLGFLREQLLDGWRVEHAILNPLLGAGAELNPGYGAALARAINDWQLAAWVEPEPRLRASVVVPWDDADQAVAEIERVGDDPAFVQVLVLARTLEPLGRRRYWPIYEAAARHRLPVAMHFTGYGAGPLTGAGYPSFYLEERTDAPGGFQEQLTSLVCEGVFERVPGLRFVLVEGGFAWLLALMWRLDRAWNRLRSEVPHLTRAPSEVIREHVYLTTQPIEEPPHPDQLLELLQALDMDERLLFATDYPHWDFDAPDRTLAPRTPRRLRDRIMHANARELYRLPSPP